MSALESLFGIDESTEDMKTLNEARGKLISRINALYLHGAITPDQHSNVSRLQSEFEKRYLGKYPKRSGDITKIYVSMNKILLFGSMFPSAEDMKKNQKIEKDSASRYFNSAYLYLIDETKELNKKYPFSN